jgi:asparagine synthase (glutamine-hydrolysing)
MCGIAGGIGFNDCHIDGVLSSIAHRGPDSSGSFVEENIFLAHTRLAIQDLSENGNQPMFSDDGRYVIIFNGEVYNHLDVREKMGNNVIYRSTGDTETVLRAFIHYGQAFLNMLNGIFALAIYDRKEKELFIARDQMGVKPLYIYKDSDSLLFSSEIKTFLNFSIDKTLNDRAFVNYLTFLWAPGSLTPFEKVTKLLPGHFLRIKDGESYLKKSVKYYGTTFTGNYSNRSESELIDELDQRLTTALKRQMLSDVPVGFFLSGGLDSSLLVAIAKKNYPEILFPCFTIDINAWGSHLEDFTDDLSYAREVAEYLQVELNVVKVDVDIVKDFDQMIWHLDEPQADPAPLNVLNIAELARKKGIKVLIGGTGGDDLFSGYRRHQALNYEKYFKLIPRFVGRCLKQICQVLPMSNSLIRRLKKITQDLDKTTEERMMGYFKWLKPEIMLPLFSIEWQNKLKQYDPCDYFKDLDKELPDEKNLLNKMLNWEQKTFLVDHNLNYTDKMGMAVGVEARVPYLDIELLEFSLTVPPELKMKGNETKYLLKKVAERYLPMDVIYRPKTGFGAPVRKWITEDLDEMIHYRLSPERLKKRGIFNPQKIWELINDNKDGKIDASYSIWALLAIDSWMNQFVYNKIQNNE